MLPYLKRSDVKIGMKVRTYQLVDLIGYWILLSDFKLVADDYGFMSETEGIIQYIGDITGRDNWKEDHPDIPVMVIKLLPYEGCDLSEIEQSY